jgi:predicted dehydrogenase
MTLHRAVFYEPGHFHAALTLRAANPRLARDIHVYATPGPECDAFVRLVESFNTRAEQPTHWRLHLHEGPDLLQRLLQDGHGDLVVLAGRNNSKLETIATLTQAGLHVLADKPWLTDSSQLPYLSQVTTGPRLAMDIMTVRHSMQAQLIAQVVHTPELFGEFVTRDDPEPSIDIGSVHHLVKRVNGQLLQRPVWYYDTAIQGDGLVDIQSHMVEQAQWWVLGAEVGDSERDVVLESARRWTTPVPLDLFQESTGQRTYSEALRSSVHDGVLQYACNGEIRYRLRGVRVRQRAEWRQREPAGTGDLHHLRLRGSQCTLHIRQGEETGYRAEISLEPAAGVKLEPLVGTAVEKWQPSFPGLSYASSSLGWRLRLPPNLDQGHESHFARVLNTFLDYLEHGTWPEALRARIRMRYTLLAQAQELAQDQYVEAPS